MTTLEELARRCEGATGPDRELDAMIAIAVDAQGEDGEQSVRKIMAGSPHNTIADVAKFWPRLKPYTASLDSAMTLVPEACAIDCLKEGEVGIWYINLRPRHWIGEWQYNTAATPALALCAAALRARAKDTTHGY